MRKKTVFKFLKLVVCTRLANALSALIVCVDWGLVTPVCDSTPFQEELPKEIDGCIDSDLAEVHQLWKTAYSPFLYPVANGKARLILSDIINGFLQIACNAMSTNETNKHVNVSEFIIILNQKCVFF